MDAHAPKTIAESDVKVIAANLVPELRQRAMQTDRDRRVPTGKHQAAGGQRPVGNLSREEMGRSGIIDARPRGCRFDRCRRLSGDRLGARRLSRARLHHRPYERESSGGSLHDKPAPGGCRGDRSARQGDQEAGRQLCPFRILALCFRQRGCRLVTAGCGNFRRKQQQARRRRSAGAGGRRRRPR